MLFFKTKAARRRELLEHPFPDDRRDLLRRDMPQYGRISPGDRAALEDTLRIIAAEKNWEGCRGLTITEPMQDLIAAYAALLLIGRRHDYYAAVQSILVYPSSFFVPKTVASIGGRVWTETVDHASGLASPSNVILSWPDVVEGARDPHDRYNVVLHEFAHKLDSEHGGIVDGVPDLPDQAAYDDWSAVLSAAYAEHTALVHAGHPTLVNPYGATNPGEFFAEATVAFFESPRRLRRMHPDLYRVFAAYYNQDPAAWPRE